MGTANASSMKETKAGERARTEDTDLDEVVALEERGDEARRKSEEVGDFGFEHAIQRYGLVS
jgi:hypothetical protein